MRAATRIDRGGRGGGRRGTHRGAGAVSSAEGDGRRTRAARDLITDASAQRTAMPRAEGPSERSARASVALIVFSLFSTAVTQELRIGVVEETPLRAQATAAAVEAALAGEGVASVPPAEPDEPLAAPAALCAEARRGAAAVVGGGAARTAALAGAAAARAGVPLLLTDVLAAGSGEALALQPHPEVFAQVCAALCAAKGWRHAVLLHEGAPAGAARLAPGDEPLRLVARRLPAPGEAALLRSLLLVLKQAGATQFVVWCDAACGARVLDAAQRVGLLAARHSYLMLTLDLHTLPLDQYSHGGANITALRLFDPESAAVQEATAAWRERYLARVQAGDGDGEEGWGARRELPTALLLAYDAVRHAARALRLMQGEGEAGRGERDRPDCGRGTGALHADSLLNYLRSEEWAGASGVMSWEADGARREVSLLVAELQRGGRLQAVGRWSRRGGLQWARRSYVRVLPTDDMTNRTFTFLIAKSQPYIMEKESAERLSGNDRYEGYCIELIERLSRLLGFNYTFAVLEDGDYGTPDNVTGQWSGMLGRLISEPDIDFAVTDLTITAQREQAVDFTTPFMNLGISLLFRTPETPQPEVLAFLLPFSNGVWICLGIAYIGTSLLLYVVGRLCHDEWQNPYPCIEDPPVLENQFTLANALWFNLGAILQQGSEIAPVAYGTRAVASVWWMFALVVTSSYTANLATLLAKQTTSEVIRNVQELADNQLGITYGAKAGGSTYTFFQHSQNELYKRMFEHMSQHELPRTNPDGVIKVMTENYAFFMESTSIEYTVERNCKVRKLGGQLDSKGYGIAMKKDSPYRQALNLALLNLQESGMLREMKHRWWIEKHGGGACMAKEEHESEDLKIRNFLGLFMVLVVGCAVGILGSCCDLAWAAARRRALLGGSFWRRYWDELRFVFHFELSVKSPHGPLFPTPSPAPSAAAGSGGSGGSPAGDSGAGSGGDGGGVGGEARARSGSAASGGRAGRARRRSSMHAASMRLARHARSRRPSQQE